MNKLVIGLILLLSACGYGVNKTTTEIGVLNTVCLKKDAWSEILQAYNPDRIQDSTFKSKIEEINRLPFPTHILYFERGPRELIAVSEDHYSVRYVYNPDLGMIPLCGMDKQLSLEEKKRIVGRVQNIIMDYQCEEGKKRSLEMLETQW